MSKYEKDEIASITIYADDVSLYPQKAMRGKITYGGQHRGERKQVPIKVRIIKTEGRPQQFAFEIQGDYHVEDLKYAINNPDEWLSSGKLWFSNEESEKLAKFILTHIPHQTTF